MIRAGMMALLALAGVARAEETDLAVQLRRLDDKALSAATAKRERPLNTMLADDVRQRLQAVNRRSTEEWRKIKTREDWEAYSRERVKALSDSLGLHGPTGQKSEYHVGRLYEGEGYRLECLVFKSP